MGVIDALEKVAFTKEEVEGVEVDRVPLLAHHHAKVLQPNLKVGVGEDVLRVAPSLRWVAGSPLAVRHQEHQSIHQLGPENHI